MKFDTENISGVFSTAWRKGCDSTSSAAVMHLLNLQKDEPYNKLLLSIQNKLQGVDKLFPMPKPENAKYWDDEIGWGKTLAPLFKSACTKGWEPYNKGSEAMALYCLFDIVPDSDWEGVGSFFWYCLMKGKRG